MATACYKSQDCFERYYGKWLIPTYSFLVCVLFVNKKRLLTSRSVTA